MKYPTTPQHTSSQTLHGQTIADPYRWLEDANNPQVQSWIAQQNKLADQYFQDSHYQQIYDELIDQNDVPIKTLPRKRGQYFYWNQRQPGQPHPVLYRGQRPHQSKPELVFDVNQLSPDGSIALTFFVISPDGQYGLYGLQHKGLETSKVYLRHLSTKQEQYICTSRLFKSSWSDNSQGFYYVKSDYLNHGALVEDDSHYQQAYYHSLDQAVDQDKLLFNAIDYLPKEATVNLHGSPDDKYVAINCWLGYSRSYNYLLKPDGQLIHISHPDQAIQTIRLIDQHIYLTTNHQAENKRILRVPLEQADTPTSQWPVFIDQDPHALLKGWSDTQDFLLLEYTQHAVSQLRVHRKADGQHQQAIQFDEPASLSGLTTVLHSNEFAYSINTFTSPSRQYWSSSPVEQPQLTYQDSRSLPQEKFCIEQVFYSSKDGTAVPMFIVRPQHLDQTVPTILYGYGGFGHSTSPGYLGRYTPWLNRGGIVALPCLRGGGEYGETWHQAGIMANKQNSFDDMIAAAEYLIEQKMTTPNQLVIHGGSNGGLLVGACLIQRPDLFKAVISAVPLMDMIRYHKFLLAHRWRHEYGDPDLKEQFGWLIKYSPYHHVDPSQTYPSVLLTAGANDTRVHPLHAWKMAARLQAGQSANPVIMRTDLDAGHQGGGGFYQSTAKVAEQLAFALKEVGLQHK